MPHPRYFLIFFCCLLFLGSCQTETTQQFIFIGHCYDWKAKDGNRVDPRIEQIDFSAYEQIWLGGDLCARTTAQDSTINYLDQLFDLQSKQTHWAVGNHDLNGGDVSLIPAKTLRPSYYVSKHEDLTILVLDTNFGHPQITYQDSLFNCTNLNQQYQLIKAVTDTISKSSHLVVLHHHGLLTPKLGDNQPANKDVFHYVEPSLPFSCTPAGNFQDLAYPLLKAVQNKGVQVVLIGGDFGQRAKRFEYKNKDGIWFLGSGINNSMDIRYQPEYVTNTNPDSILVFNYDLKTRELDWTFHQLNEFISAD